MSVFGGYWNYWTILFYALLAIFLFNIKSFSRKELSIFVLICIYFVHFFLNAFNKFAFWELFLVSGHSILTKLQFIMQLAGGLFVGIVFNKFLSVSWARNIKNIGIAKAVTYLFMLIYGFISFCFLSGVLVNIISRNKLEIWAQKLLSFLVTRFSVLSSFNDKYKERIGEAIYSISHTLLNHFFNSEFTVKYLLIFISRLGIIILFYALIRILIKRAWQQRKVYIIISAILMLFVAERISILKLYCPFNQDAPKNFSEDYKEVSFLKKNSVNLERFVIISHSPEELSEYVMKKSGIQGSNESALSWLNKEIFYDTWKDFPESGRNGMPLYSVLNLPSGISNLNHLYPTVPSDIWMVYNQMNSRSVYYKESIGKNKRVPIQGFNFDIYSITSPLIDMLGARYVLSTMPLDAGKISLLFKGDRYYLYENRQAYPRVWVVDNYYVERDRAKVLSMIDNETVDLKKNALVEQDIPDWYPLKDNTKLAYTTNILTYKPNYLKIIAEVNKKSLLVLSDTYFKYWCLSVDGKKAKIERVNFLLRGALLEPGIHVLIFNFRPTAFFCSLALSGIAFAVVLGYFIFIMASRHKIQTN